MASFARAGRFGVSSIESARELATRLDGMVHKAVGDITFESVNSFFIKLRVYLQVQNDRLGATNNPFGILKRIEDASGLVLFNLGPQIDKGDTPDHFHFPSGARLSFGVALRRGNPCSLVSFRFHYQFADAPAPAFVRFDLNPDLHQDPLIEPRCHLHPSLDHVRLPTPALTPFEVLDRIFFALEASAVTV
jgi:hypothetical protein